jgi:hypothetical protein
MEETTNSIIDKIRTWLREEDIQENKIDDNKNEFHMTLWYSKNIKLEGIVNRDKLTISSPTMIFADNTKHLFLVNENSHDELDSILHQQNANFVFLYSNNESRDLVGIRIFKDIFSESLTKTSFFDTILAVQHSIYLVMIKERE